MVCSSRFEKNALQYDLNILQNVFYTAILNLLNEHASDMSKKWLKPSCNNQTLTPYLNFYTSELLFMFIVCWQKMPHIFRTLFFVSISCLVPMRSFPQAVDTAIEGYGAWTNLLSLEIIKQA